MTGVAPLILSLVLATGAQARLEAGLRAAPQQAAQEVIAEIQIHGNLIVSNDDVLKIAGVSQGEPFGPTTVDEVTARLRASKQFDQVQVLKRFASIEDPSRIALVIVVNEGPVRLSRNADGALSVVRRRGVRNLMFMPIVNTDGYGLTYGVRLAVVNRAGAQSRLSFPLTWGASKRAAVEYERRFSGGLLTRVETGTEITRLKNPAFDANDDRQGVWGIAERAAGPFRADGMVELQRVSFFDVTDRLLSVSGTVTFDTRLDPVLPRNAVLASAEVKRFTFGARDALNTLALDGNAYIGLIGQTVLALHASRDSSDGPRPLYLKPLLGGWSTLRGYGNGAFVGDIVTYESVELRVPITSPLKLVKLGVSAFVDAGKAYDDGQRYDSQPLRRAIGGGVWMTATVIHVGVTVARTRDGDTKANFGGGFSF